MKNICKVKIYFNFFSCVQGLEPYFPLVRGCPNQLDEYAEQRFYASLLRCFGWLPPNLVRKIGLEPTCMGEGQLGPTTIQYVNFRM